MSPGFKHTQSQEGWDGSERRASCVTPATNFEQYLHTVLDKQAGQFAQQLEATAGQFTQQLEDSVAKIEALVKSAVPEGDLESHRRAHKIWIEEAERRQKFRDAVIEKTLSSLFLAALVAAGTILLSGGLKKIGIDWPAK